MGMFRRLFKLYTNKLIPSPRLVGRRLAVPLRELGHGGAGLHEPPYSGLRFRV